MPHPRRRGTALRQRLAELRGPDVPAKALDARALAALAANPGCARRAVLDGAGVDKTRLADALGSPSAFGQSQFALTRGNAFEARVKADGGAELLRLAHRKLDPQAAPPEEGRVPDLSAIGPEGRAARTALALREAVEAGGWTLLDHPMLALDVAGSPAFLEPDAVVVHPDGSWTVVEIKSFPMLDGSADPAKVGAAARQAAVYVLALEEVAARLDPAPRVRHRILLVCPKDFSNLPAASAVDVRKQRAVTRRQLARLTRIEEIVDALPEGTCFSPELPAAELTAAVESVPAAYAPECLSACELAFHCRARSRAQAAVTSLGRAARAELGGLTTVGDVLSAARGESGDPDDPAVAALRRAARLRVEALAALVDDPDRCTGTPGHEGSGTPVHDSAGTPAQEAAPCR
ncbi:Putative secreted protein OS=Streptomyces glaucescens OX=1907 GN=SGLAU_12820 PE=4 SV=1 [Streptomyces glaucescens]